MQRDPAEMSLVNPLDRTAPQLRHELAFRPQSFGGKTCYVIEDPVSARFFRIGVAEYTFISLLSGQRTLSEVLSETIAARPDCGFTPSDALAICQWVVRTGLAHDWSLDADTLASSESVVASTRRCGGRVSPLSVQLPLFHPDRFFQRLTPWLRWCFSFPAAIGWLLIIGWAVRDLIAHGDRLSDASVGILAIGNWFWLGLAWILLKVIHECGHAIDCKRLGGEVREAGVIFILLAPLAYVDVTSSWRLRSKWERIHVAAAGMYVEVFLAAVATLIWARTAPGIVNQICFNVMTTASIMTVIFNANPLMRFDGYYILSDFLELPNLYTLGQQYVSHIVRRLLFGMQAALPVWSGTRGTLIRCYGLASLFWRNMVFFGLVLAAATLLQGAGVVLSALALLLWSGANMRRLVRFWRHGSVGKRGWTRCAIVGGGGSAMLVVALAVVPWPGTVTAPAIVRYAPQTVVRTESEGFVERICVQGGQQVELGQVLVVMTNDELQYALRKLALSIEASRLKRRIHQSQLELAKSQAEEEELRTLEKQYAEKQEQVAHLVVVAPCAGKVIGRNLSTLEGTYLKKGSDLLSIGNESAKEVRMSIAQQDIGSFRASMHRTLRTYLPGTAVLRAPLSKIEPRASAVPLDVSLCAPHGGDLAVRNPAGDTTDARYAGLELLSPRFTGVIPLDAEQSRIVFAGQRARVALHSYESVGRHLYQLVRDWADRKLHRSDHRRIACE